MSDPVTNVEIEDVLSSIRRLVSEDSRPKAVPPKRAAPERLVLTPAQRVPEDAVDDELEAAEDSTPAPLILATPAVPESARAEDAPDAEAAEEGSSASGDTVLSRLIGEEVARVLDSEFGDDDDATDPEEAEVAEQAVPEAEVSEDDEQDQDVADEAGEPEEGVTHILEAPVEAVAAPEPDEHPAPSGDTALERKIAALETLISRNAPVEDADEEPAAFVRSPAKPAPREEPAPVPRRIPRPAMHHADEYEDEADAIATLAEESPLIDEDMLRDLVAEIVRQELQGTLGERITRNVRKLVRREIHRILMSQEFE